MGDKKGGYIDKFLKKADKAIQEGVKKADEALEEAVEFGSMTAKQAAKTSKELRNQAKKERETLQKKGIAKINEGLTNAYPWTGAPSTNDYGAANIGQVKNVFGFPLPD